MAREHQQVWMEHPNAQVIRDFFTALVSADATRMRGIACEDVIWHFPGNSPVAGDWQDIDGILHGLHAVTMILRNGGSGSFELLEVTANDRCALSVHRGLCHDLDTSLNLHFVLNMRMKGGKIAEVWKIPFYLYENDRFNNKLAGVMVRSVVSDTQGRSNEKL